MHLMKAENAMSLDYETSTQPFYISCTVTSCKTIFWRTWDMRIEEGKSQKPKLRYIANKATINRQEKTKNIQVR